MTRRRIAALAVTLALAGGLAPALTATGAVAPQVAAAAHSGPHASPDVTWT